MNDLSERITRRLDDLDGGANNPDTNLLAEAVRAALGEHTGSVASAGVNPKYFGEGKCGYCDKAPMIREYRDHLNGGSRKVLMHDHVDPHPVCTSCVKGYDGLQPWPCPTVRAVAAALGVKA